MITERRQHPRKTPLEFTFIQLEQEFAGHVVNYSKEGLSFETSAPICDSDLVQFWLSFRQHGQIDGVGRITWLNDKKNRGGIAFVHLSRSSREKVEEWTAAPGGAGAAVGPEPEDEESPKEIVSKIMEKLTEKRPAMASPSLKPVEGGNGAGIPATQVQEAERTEASNSTASDLLPPPETSDRVHLTLPRTTEPPETRSRDTAPTIAATAEESVDLRNADAALSIEAHEAESTEEAHLLVPPAFTPATPETGEFWNAPGTLAPESWHVESTAVFDSSTLSSVDLRPSPEGSPAPQQDNGAAANFDSELTHPPVRKWPTPPRSGHTTPTEQDQDSSLRNSSQEGMRELVPLKRYTYAQRSQFLRGAAIGIFLSFVIAIFAFKFWKPARQSTPSEDTRKAVAANSSIASGATIPKPAFPPGLVQESKGSASFKQGQNAISSRKPPSARANVAAPRQLSRTSGIASGDGAAATSAEDSSDAPTNAIPRPSSFADRNSATGSGIQGLFNLSQPGNSDGPTANAEPGNGQSKVGADLDSTFWSFHRKNIHGTLPALGGEVRAAELIHSVAPHYPEAAKAQHISGDVVIEAIIDTQGNVRKPQVVSGPMLLRPAAVNAVLEWKYKPGLLDGKPTEMRETIRVRFLP